ncbi:MAG: sigma 54-interacting transcriptional regulator, partial [Deltaproteobacteria bacterium]|nr:sigma 54-interacting transcriptional regulator [Deltaproteobacteria bacterium]
AILTVGETTTIEDLGSANGTVVRGRRLAAGHRTTIAIGELVSLGTLSIMLQQQSRGARTRRLWQRQYFEARLDEACAREERYRQGFALVHIHIDDDSAVDFIEETLAELVRDSDILTRWGPHEYNVLLPDTEPAKADDAVRRLDGELVKRGLKCRVSVACCPRDGRSPYQLVAKVQAKGIKDKTVTGGSEIVVFDAQMQSLHRLVEQIAGSQIGVLLLGETGVGKEVFARAVHRASRRTAGPFVELNCAALTETLLESELFGHEKGAFTNATSAKPGLIESADGGTLLLDEIGDMPLTTQVKLLRVIEDSQLRRVGSLKARSVDVRFVAATNCDLETKIARGEFRSDLFFRLNGVTIVIPPLRERLAEIEPLARIFISRAGRSEGHPPPALAPEALELMKSYSWPGNIRELKHMMERATLLCGRGPISPEHLPVDKISANLTANRPPLVASSIVTPAESSQLPSGVQLPGLPPVRRKGSDEEKQIVEALERAGGNQTLAARLLGISRRTLVNRLNEYEGVQRPRKTKRP